MKNFEAIYPVVSPKISTQCPTHPPKTSVTRKIAHDIYTSMRTHSMTCKWKNNNISFCLQVNNKIFGQLLQKEVNGILML